MTAFSIGDWNRPGELPKGRFITLDEFYTIIKSRSIVDFHGVGSEAVLTLSGDLLLRVRQVPGPDLHLNLNMAGAHDLPPFVLQLGNAPLKMDIAVLEQKLAGLRFLYTAFYLFHADRLAEAVDEFGVAGLTRNRELLERDERLYIEAISYGSWNITVWPGTKRAFQALISLVGAAYGRGRDAFLRRLEAQASLEEARARKEWIQAAEMEFKLQKERTEYIRKIAEKIPHPEKRLQMEHLLYEHVEMLRLADNTNSVAIVTASGEGTLAVQQSAKRSGP